MEVLWYTIISISIVIWVNVWLVHLDIQHMDNVLVDIREELKKQDRK